MNSLLTLYAFYQHPVVKIVRLVVVVIVLIALYFYSLDILKSPVVDVLLVLFIVNEIFIHFQVQRVLPQQSITQSTQDFSLTLMPDVAIHYKNAKDSADWVRSSQDEAAHQLLTRLKINFIDVSFPKEQLLSAAGQYVQQIHGDYITSLDLFTAYIHLTEEQTHALHDASLTASEMLNLSLWLRHHYQSDQPERFHMEFKGAGAFDFFVFGWSNQIRQFADNFTFRAVSTNYAPIITGRENEYKQLLSALTKSSGNNVLLVGEPGTGKTSLVEYFARESYDGVIPARLNHITIYELLVDRLLAGVQNQGELEARLGELVAEIAHSGNVLLYIPNLENIFGGGGFEFDLSGVLLPYLEKNVLQIIGATTQPMYATYLEDKPTVTNLFDVIEVEEPDETITVQMLLQRLSELEHQRHVAVEFSAIEEVAKLAKTFTPGKNLPGGAFDLLENVISAVSVEGKKNINADDVKKFVQSKTKILLDEPDQDEKSVLLHLEDKIHQRMVDQEEAVNVVAATLRRLRSGFVDDKRPISVFLFLGPTGVGKTELAKSLAALYFGDENRMIRIDMSELKSVNDIGRLLGEMPGQPYIPDSLVEQVEKNPFSVVLLDEFEKADPQIHDLFLQIFDEGHVTSNKGQKVSFIHTIIIATSNAGSEYIRESMAKGVEAEQLRKSLNEYVLQSHLFKPELLNRFDDIVVFKPLQPEHVVQIARMMLEQQLKTLEAKEIFISPDQSVVQKVAQDAYSEEYGARNIRRYITEVIEAAVSQWILQDVVVKDKKYALIMNNNELTLVEQT